MPRAVRSLVESVEVLLSLGVLLLVLLSLILLSMFLLSRPNPYLLFAVRPDKISAVLLKAF